MAFYCIKGTVCNLEEEEKKSKKVNYEITGMIAVKSMYELQYGGGGGVVLASFF